MANGVIYVTVGGETTSNRPVLLDSSDVEGGGSVTTTYWIHWTTAGFTAKDWSYIENYILDTGWPDFAIGTSYSRDYNGFLDYVTNGSFDNLDKILGDGYWDKDSKADFVFYQGVNLGKYDKGGCIEIRNS